MSRNKKLNTQELEQLDKQFEITSVCRADLMNPEIGLSKRQALEITDVQMTKLAGKLADDYTGQLFWNSLSVLADIVLNEK